jgi:hypothetical protein
MDQNLYILVFKNEPLIKVGLSIDAYRRSLGLGFGRFDLKDSYLVRARDQSAISLLERNLKTFFSGHQVAPSQPLSSGNTETFPSSILPEMLQAIEVLGKTFPHAEFRIHKDLSSAIRIRREASRLAGADLKEKRLEKLKALEELLPTIPVHSIEIVEDSERRFECKINLLDGKKVLGEQLFEAGRMDVLFSKGGGPGWIQWGIGSFSTGLEDEACSVHLYFDLRYSHRCSESLVQNDVAERSLTLWRNFVSEQTVLLDLDESVQFGNPRHSP